MVYLMSNEIKQMRQLGWDYVSNVWNLIDWTSFGINIAFAINRYTGILDTPLMMKLCILNMILTWGTFVFWLRLFENYVLYIMLIKQTVKDMTTFFSLYVGVLCLFTGVTWAINYVIINDPSNEDKVPLYNDTLYVSGSKINAIINQFL